jgi:hypothetical protein
MPRADEAIMATTATTGLTDRSTIILFYKIQQYQQTCYMHFLPTVPVFSASNGVVDPDPYDFGPPGSGSGYVIILFRSVSDSFHQQAKKVLFCSDPYPIPSINKRKK